jgi:hypothetical protein
MNQTDEMVASELYATLYRLLHDASDLSPSMLHKLSYVLLAIQSLPCAIGRIKFNLSIEHPDDVGQPTKSVWQLLYFPERLVLGKMNIQNGIITADQCEILHEINTEYPCMADSGIYWCEEVQNILDTREADLSIEGEFKNHTKGIWGYEG